VNEKKSLQIYFSQRKPLYTLGCREVVADIRGGERTNDNVSGTERNGEDSKKFNLMLKSTVFGDVRCI
jgi:hypothetical protein